MFHLDAGGTRQTLPSSQVSGLTLKDYLPSFLVIPVLQEVHKFMLVNFLIEMWLLVVSILLAFMSPS